MNGQKEVKTNVLLLGIILAILSYCAGALVVGAVVLAVAITLFVVRNGLVSR